MNDSQTADTTLLDTASGRTTRRRLSRRGFLQAAAPLITACGCKAETQATTAAAALPDMPPLEGLPPGEGEEWPCFLGPRRNATSRETGLQYEWPKEGPPVLWEREVGEAYGAPVVAKGKLVLFHRVGDEEIIECLDAADASQAHWKHGYPTNYSDQYGYNGGPRSSPAVVDDRVFTYGAEGVLTCLDFASGERVWQRRLIDEYRVPQGFFGAGTAPVLEDGLVLLNLGGPDQAGVAAFDAKTGETVWTTSADSASYSTPIVGTVHGERLAIFHTGDGLLVVEPKTGKQRYSYPFRSNLYESAIAATPVLVGDIVFLSETYEVGAVALRLAPDGLEVVWRDENAMQNHWATSVYHQGYLYGMDGRHEMGSNFRCIEFMSGKVQWTASKGLGRASFIMADGHFIAIGESGELALIEVNPERYIEKQRARVMRKPVWTPPILSHGLVYLRNDELLKCLDLRA